MKMSSDSRYVRIVTGLDDATTGNVENLKGPTQGRGFRPAGPSWERCAGLLQEGGGVYDKRQDID